MYSVRSINQSAPLLKGVCKMARPETTYDENSGLYVDGNGNSYYDTEGRESADGDD